MLWKENKIRCILYYLFRIIYFFFFFYFIYWRITSLLPDFRSLFEYPIVTVYAVIFISLAGLQISKEIISSDKKLWSALLKNLILVFVLYILPVYSIKY